MKDYCNNTKTALLATLLFCLLPSTVVSADTQPPPVIIYDSGHTSPIRPLFEDADQADIAPTRPTVTFGFPIESGWRAEHFQRKRVSIPRLPRPFFVVGCDQTSGQWLLDRKDDLTALNTVGFVVECETYQDFENLVRMAHPLPLQSMQGAGIGDALGHHAYPALISQHAIEQ